MTVRVIQVEFNIRDEGSSRLGMQTERLERFIQVWSETSDRQYDRIVVVEIAGMRTEMFLAK